VSFDKGGFGGASIMRPPTTRQDGDPKVCPQHRRAAFLRYDWAGALAHLSQRRMRPRELVTSEVTRSAGPDVVMHEFADHGATNRLHGHAALS